MDDALKNQLLDSVKDTYVRELRNQYTRYMEETTRDLLDHLMDRYSNITSYNLKFNKARINEAFDHSRPIDVFFQFINDAVQYDDDVNTRLWNFFLQTAFHSVNTTGMYREACKELRQKGEADKIWTNFKRHFAAEYHEIREQQRILGEVEFNSAQLAHETIDMETALEYQALAATDDRNIVADLIAINKKMVDTNTALVAQVISLAETNVRLANT